ncbi:MAG: biotin/lipoyl-binding protein, partial [Desulfobacteraceae bacterium]|nr:biotin/lipoyl-binding protein [Desulfobacteraceae bacterium]
MKKAEPTGPDAEIKLATHLFFLLFIVLFFSFGIWAFFSTLDIMSITTGEVVPSGNIKQIQHLEGGIIKNILVKEGQIVKKGQPLIELENTASKSTVEELKIRTASLSINITRLEAELAGVDYIEFDKNLAKDHKDQIEQAKELFYANREQLKNLQESQRRLVAQRSQSLDELKTRLRNQEKRIKLLNEQVKISESLLEDELTSRYDHLNLLKESNLLQSSIEENRIAVKRADSALKEQESRLASILSSYKQTVQVKLEENRQN